MNKQRLERILCNPDPVRRVLRYITMVLMPPVMAGIIAFCHDARCHPGKNSALALTGSGGYILLALALLMVPAAILLCLLRREKQYLTLRKRGRLSWEFLESSGLAEQAAEEYFGTDRTGCRLKHSGGTSFHPFSHRENVFTAHFAFLMCDNIVLHYSEIHRTRTVRCARNHKGRRFIEYLLLRMKNGTDLSAMSVSIYSKLLRPSPASGERYLGAIDTMQTILGRIEAANPQCDVSLELAKNITPRPNCEIEIDHSHCSAISK